MLSNGGIQLTHTCSDDAPFLLDGRERKRRGVSKTSSRLLETSLTDTPSADRDGVVVEVLLVDGRELPLSTR